MKRGDFIMKRSDFVKLASERIGTNGTYLFEKYGTKTHWCMMLVYDLEHDVAGISEMPLTFSCSAFTNTDFAKKRANHDYKTAEVGDIVFFEINGCRADGADHVGVVLENTGKSIKLLEGNTNGGNGLYFDSSTANVFEYNYNAGCFDCIIDMSDFFTDDEEPTKPQYETFTAHIRTLKRGCKGNDVKMLQRLLYSSGYSVGSAFDDGDFGPCTEKGLREFQEDHKLEADGICGEKTFTEMWKP